jgi:hypothetical protein
LGFGSSVSLVEDLKSKLKRDTLILDIPATENEQITNNNLKIMDYTLLFLIGPFFLKEKNLLFTITIYLITLFGILFIKLEGNFLSNLAISKNTFLTSNIISGVIILLKRNL